MAPGESNGHVTDTNRKWHMADRPRKVDIRDPNMFGAHYLEMG